MDPNKALRALRDIAKSISDLPDDRSTDTERAFARLFTELDDHLRDGGVKPDSWVTTPGGRIELILEVTSGQHFSGGYWVKAGGVEAFGESPAAAIHRLRHAIQALVENWHKPVAMPGRGGAVSIVYPCPDPEARYVEEFFFPDYKHVIKRGQEGVEGTYRFHAGQPAPQGWDLARFRQHLQKRASR